MATNASTQEHRLTSEDQIVHLPTSEKEKSPALEDEIAGQEGQKDTQKEIEGFETGSTVSTKIQTLHNNKKSAKTRLTKAKNHLNDLLENQPPGTGLPRKNAIQRGINKVQSESVVLKKIIRSLKEVYATSGELEGTDTIIDTLDKELDEIIGSVDSVIEAAEKNVQERLANGEDESDLLSLSKSDDQSSVLSISSSYVKRKQQEAREATERLLEVEKEQKDKEKALEKLIAEF